MRTAGGLDWPILLALCALQGSIAGPIAGRLLPECPGEIRIAGLDGGCASVNGVYVNTQRLVGGRPAFVKTLHVAKLETEHSALQSVGWITRGGDGLWSLRTKAENTPWGTTVPLEGGRSACPEGRWAEWPPGGGGRPAFLVRMDAAWVESYSCGGGGELESEAEVPSSVVPTDCFGHGVDLAARYLWCCGLPPGDERHIHSCFTEGYEYEVCCAFEYGLGTRILPALWQRVVHLDYGGRHIRLQQNVTHGYGCILWSDTIARLLILGPSWQALPVRVLDIGTGLGLAAIAVAGMATEVLAIDNDDCALRHAKRNVAGDATARGRVIVDRFDVCDGPAAFFERYGLWEPDMVMVEFVSKGPEVLACIAVLLEAVGRPDKGLTVFVNLRPDHGRWTHESLERHGFKLEVLLETTMYGNPHLGPSFLLLYKRNL